MNMHVEPPSIKTPSILVFIHELLDWYYDTHLTRSGSAATAPSSRTSIKWLKAHFGDTPIGDVTQEDTDEFIRLRTAGEIGNPSKLHSIDKDLRLLKAAINRAIRKRRLSPGAAPTFDTNIGWARRERFLTRKEAADFLRAARKYRQMRNGNAAWKLGPEEVFVWIALYSAQRSGRISALRWFPQVDFATRTVDFVDRTKPQTKKRAARQPMHPAMFRVLRRWFRDCGNERGDTVLPAKFNAGEACKELCRLSGVSGVTPHVFRHTFLTWRVAAGVPLFNLSEVTGVSMQTLLTTYAHLMPVTGYDAMISAKAKTISGARV
jgi:integrase